MAQFESDFFCLLFFDSGDIPLENSLLRQVSSLLRRLPVTESGKFQDDFLMVSASMSHVISVAQFLLQLKT